MTAVMPHGGQLCGAAAPMPKPVLSTTGRVLADRWVCNRPAGHHGPHMEWHDGGQRVAHEWGR